MKSQARNIIPSLFLYIEKYLYSAYLIKNVKENLEEVDIEKVNRDFEKFVKIHNIEIDRIKK
ncbi:hypothetical protein EGX98_09495 [Fusobacterium necrophorum]|nr:hypothetical protein [Fusobacterium necrophorum]AYZ74241.1 hypothetical protein EGX98_09495 [Fusobacterium necrophorum]AZW09877.1 hypothetical protein EO219_10065 [Fusobacterium necrophorum subsp. necrophorum]MBR8732496.1 hypothetical protein [Fusobacterium necrophorum]MBR8788672.1 hypothetical protein [Fusobacterium necrophorum]MBR8822656.1 hypothetical protein [Fusobacterium necrophorum]